MKQKVVSKSRRQNENAHDLLTYLPSEIMINILLRLTVITIMRCKCVCKSWRDLIETSEFVKFHRSKSVPGLAVYMGHKKKQYKIVEFVVENHLNIVFSFDPPWINEWQLHGSTNGLLFVCIGDNYPRDLFICNPITQEYIRLPSPLETSPRGMESYGFGVSKMSGEYKVVRINLDVDDCQVYTVGTGSWRRIASDDMQVVWEETVGAFLNGNLHWLSNVICCFDLETELFSTFSPPPRHDQEYSIVSVLGDYLCVCDTTIELSVFYEIEIWLMKEYGDEKSWTKAFHIDKGYWIGDHCPIKVFKDGDMLMQWGSNALIYYSEKHDSDPYIPEVDLFKGDCSCATIYAPSFLPLKTFAMENVSSF